jgi:hypothetical protein
MLASLSFFGLYYFLLSLFCLFNSIGVSRWIDKCGLKLVKVSTPRILPYLQILDQLTRYTTLAYRRAIYLVMSSFYIIASSIDEIVIQLEIL